MSDFTKDGTFDWSMGQDAWHDPNKLQANQYAAGVNVSPRGGRLAPRPAFHQVPLRFEQKTLGTVYGYLRHIKDVWEAGKFQALIPFDAGSDQYLIVVICGLIFKTNINTWTTVLLSDDIKLDQYQPRINWSYAGQAIVIYDYPDYPVIVEIEAGKVYRSDPEHKVNGELQPQVPIARMGTYNQNRLVIANDGTEFTAGDPVGNLLTPEAPLTFTEIFTPSSPYVNQFFSLPTEEAISHISAMGFIQQLDSSTGIGPLFIGTEKKVAFFRTDTARDQWSKQQFGGVVLANVGIAGPRAFVNVNSDLVFLSAEGNVHSFTNARNQAKQWGNVPISREVKNYLKFNDATLAQFACLGAVGNRVLISANPYRVQALDRSGRPVTDYAHGGFVALDIDPMSSFLMEGTPIWDGLWTGVNPMDICTVGKRCFIMSKDGCGGSGYNALYELREDSQHDIVRGHERQIRAIVYTKSYTFNDDFAQKREHTLTFHLHDLEGPVYFKVERKPSHSDEFNLWGEWRHEAPNSTEEMPLEELLNGFAKHQLKQIIFGDPVEDRASEINDDLFNTFRALQLRITIQADAWSLDHAKVEVRLVPFLERQEAENCETLRKVSIPKQPEPDWLIPEISLCNQ